MFANVPATNELVEPIAQATFVKPSTANWVLLGIPLLANDVHVITVEVAFCEQLN